MIVHHKRKRPKNRRAGCLLCKPYKANGAKDKDPPNEKRKLQEPCGADAISAF